MIIKHKPASSYRRGGISHLKYSKYRYGGSGIFSNMFGKKLIQDNVNHLINRVSKSQVGQKAADAVLAGTKSAIKSQTKKGIEELATQAVNKIKEKTNKKKHTRTKEQNDILKTAIQSLTPINIPKTSAIEGIIKSGKGIVYD